MTPRIRPDLKATPAEEQGVKYFDVADPRSGSRMRMYDFEWLIAEQMNGARRFDEVASYARERLGIHPSPSDLEAYADKLAELGFLEDGMPTEPTIDQPDTTPLPVPAAAAPTSTGKVTAIGDQPPAKSGAGSLILVILVILGVGGAVAYMKFFKPQSTHVTVALASPREVVRLYDGVGMVKKTEAQVLS